MVKLCNSLRLQKKKNQAEYTELLEAACTQVEKAHREEDMPYPEDYYKLCISLAEQYIFTDENNNADAAVELINSALYIYNERYAFNMTEENENVLIDLHLRIGDLYSSCSVHLLSERAGQNYEEALALCMRRYARTNDRDKRTAILKLAEKVVSKWHEAGGSRAEFYLEKVRKASQLFAECYLDESPESAFEGMLILVRLNGSLNKRMEQKVFLSAAAKKDSEVYRRLGECYAAHGGKNSLLKTLDCYESEYQILFSGKTDILRILLNKAEKSDIYRRLGTDENTERAAFLCSETADEWLKNRPKDFIDDINYCDNKENQRLVERLVYVTLSAYSSPVTYEYAMQTLLLERVMYIAYVVRGGASFNPISFELNRSIANLEEFAEKLSAEGRSVEQRSCNSESPAELAAFAEYLYKAAVYYEKVGKKTKSVLLYEKSFLTYKAANESGYVQLHDEFVSCCLKTGKACESSGEYVGADERYLSGMFYAERGIETSRGDHEATAIWAALYLRSLHGFLFVRSGGEITSEESKKSDGSSKDIVINLIENITAFLEESDMTCSDYEHMLDSYKSAADICLLCHGKEGVGTAAEICRKAFKVFLEDAEYDYEENLENQMELAVDLTCDVISFIVDKAESLTDDYSDIRMTLYNEALEMYELFKKKESKWEYYCFDQKSKPIYRHLLLSAAYAYAVREGNGSSADNEYLQKYLDEITAKDCNAKPEELIGAADTVSLGIFGDMWETACSLCEKACNKIGSAALDVSAEDEMHYRSMMSKLCFDSPFKENRCERSLVHCLTYIDDAKSEAFKSMEKSSLPGFERLTGTLKRIIFTAEYRNVLVNRAVSSLCELADMYPGAVDERTKSDLNEMRSVFL